MIFSRQFRGLLTFAGVWAVPWAVTGAGLAVVRWLTSAGAFAGTTLGAWILNHVLGYGALGMLSGLCVGLLLARRESGRRVEDLSARRVALWGAIGGAAPSVLFAALGVIVDAPAVVYLPLLGLGLLSAAVSGGLAIAAVASARPGLPPPDRPPSLPAR